MSMNVIFNFFCMEIPCSGKGIMELRTTILPMHRLICTSSLTLHYVAHCSIGESEAIPISSQKEHGGGSMILGQRVLRTCWMLVSETSGMTKHYCGHV
jgi:hypothetical protein